MNFSLTREVIAGFVLMATAVMLHNNAHAQCSTCATPTVAYQPVAVQPATVYQPAVTYQYNGWYPGKLLDRMRLRRYGVATAAAPAYSTYTASYAPYTAGYTPYVTAYAPLTRTTVAHPIVQTSYYQPMVAASPCSSCVQTVARPVVLSPVVTAGCSTCAVSPCGGCSACSTIPAEVSPATYTQPACSNCASGQATPSYTTPSLEPTYPSSGPSVGPPTPQPQLAPTEPVPSQSNYPKTPENGQEHDPLNHIDPLPREDVDSGETSTYFEAPRLFAPQDRTAKRSNSKGPTVDVWNAVYHNSTNSAVNQTSHKRSRTQAEIDADGWQAVPSSR